MTNSFNYLREPDSDGMFDSNYTRQSQNLEQLKRSGLKDLDASIKNQQTDSTKLLEGIKSFSPSINDLLVKRHEDAKKDALAKAQMDVRRGYHDESQKQALEDAQLEQDNLSRTINTAGADIKKRDGNSSVLAQELYARDPYYEAAVNQLLIQERANETGQRLLAAQQTLTIAGVDGEELSYDQITKPSDMAAWTAKFEAQDIRENFSEVTAEGFSLYANERYTNTINQHSNAWATKNAAAQEKERLLTEQNVIMQSFNDGYGSFRKAATSALYSKRLTPDQLFDLMLTGVESGAVSQATLKEMSAEIPHTGGGTTSLAKLIGLQNHAKLQKAFIDKGKADYRDRQQANDIRVKERIAQIRLSLIDDPDGVPRETLEAERKKLIRANGGHAVPEMDEIIENYSAEAIAKDNALNFDIEREKRLMNYGLFDEGKMKNYPLSVQAKLKAYQSQLPNYQQNRSLIKAQKAEIENLVDLQVKNLPDGKKAKGTDLFKQELNTLYEGYLQNGMDPELAFDKTRDHFKDRIEEEGFFKKGKGFVGMFRSEEAFLADHTNINSRLRYGTGKWQSLGKDTEAVLQTKNALYSDEILKIKVNQLRLGKAQFDAYDKHMADLLGYTHPSTMIKDILDRNPIIVNGEPLMFEPPPILELAENLQTPEQTRLFNSDIISARRAISMQPQSTGLPVRVKADAKESEMLNYMTNEIGMSQFHALGLLVNGIRESSLHTSNPGDNGTSDGMFQWHAERLTRARASLGGNWNDWRSQIKYALEEEGEPGQEYLQQQFSSAQEAADWWMRRWERPAHQDRDSRRHTEILRDLQY